MGRTGLLKPKTCATPRVAEEIWDSATHDLKAKTARGAVASTFGQGASFFVRFCSMLVLARLLAPTDFGVVAMATASTEVLGLFQDCGLSLATVQRESITRAQSSTLFWINLGVSGIMAAICVALAPILTHFFHEGRLFWVTILIGVGFVFTGASAQHRALLMRNMHFAALAVIDIIALLVSVSVGIGMALAGQGYWALVALNLCLPLFSMLGVWTAGGWFPGRPRRGTGVRSMLSYGGALTLNGVIYHIAYNADKVLLGRFWGAEVLGIYGRAYNLINVPVQTFFKSTIGTVAFPALSRLQNDGERLRSYFLKGYGLFLSLVLPVTMGCALFPRDIIFVFLGPKWGEAAVVFRLLAPTIFAFALINPLGWFILASGHAGRSVRIALVSAPVLILGYLCGVGHGAQGVAAGYSIASLLLVVPVVFWSTRGTPVRAFDILRVAAGPSLSVFVGAAATLAFSPFLHLIGQPLLRLTTGSAILFGVYFVVLWFCGGQKDVYLSVIREVGIWPFAGRRRQSS